MVRSWDYGPDIKNRIGSWQGIVGDRKTWSDHENNMVGSCKSTVGTRAIIVGVPKTLVAPGKALPGQEKTCADHENALSEKEIA